VTRVLASRGCLLGLGVVAAAAGCGDPMLPADYQGPPASAISASAFQIAPFKEARLPRMSLEWLTSLDASPGSTTLTGQPLRFTRSPAVDTDWDIGLDLPIEGARFERPLGTSAGSSVRIAVGKIIYYDDQDNDGRLTWNCRSTINCDAPKAVSVEFVVYVDATARCAFGAGADPRRRVSAGYHYYQYQGGSIRELPADQPMSFFLADRSLAEYDPSEELRAFANVLLQAWTQALLTPGCG
jgi:hypothetical protein